MGFNSKEAAKELVDRVSGIYPDGGPPQPDGPGERNRMVTLSADPQHRAAMDLALSHAEDLIDALSHAQRAESHAEMDRQEKDEDRDWLLVMTAQQQMLTQTHHTPKLYAQMLAIGAADRPDAEDERVRNLRCRLLTLRGAANAAESMKQSVLGAGTAGSSVSMARNYGRPVEQWNHGGTQASNAVIKTVERVFDPAIVELRRECRILEETLAPA